MVYFRRMNLTLKVWRQKNAKDLGHVDTYEAKDIPTEASFLEMLDIVNEGLIVDGQDPIHFDHDCREGICGMCSLTINGVPHSKEMSLSASSNGSLRTRSKKESSLRLLTGHNLFKAP